MICQRNRKWMGIRYTDIPTEFCFRADKIDGKYQPKVIIDTKENQKSIDKMMNDAKYTKVSGLCEGYEE